MAYDTRGRLTRLDGRRVHWVEDYEGERFSLITFTVVGVGTPIGHTTHAREYSGEAFYCQGSVHAAVPTESARGGPARTD